MLKIITMILMLTTVFHTAISNKEDGRMKYCVTITTCYRGVKEFECHVFHDLESAIEFYNESKRKDYTRYTSYQYTSIEEC